MCLPISVLTKGQISGGCCGVCRLWPHLGALLVLCAGLVWNFARRFISEKVKD